MKLPTCHFLKCLIIKYALLIIVSSESIERNSKIIFILYVDEC